MPTDGPIGTSLSFSFADSELTHSNLNNQGPDTGAEEVRFEGLGQYAGTSFDLVRAHRRRLPPPLPPCTTTHRGRTDLPLRC